MVDLQQKVIDEIERQKEDLLALCSKLLQMNTENPPGDTSEISEFIIRYLSSFGIETEVHESNPKMFNLISSIGENKDNKHLILCGHTDVVPVGDLEKWDFDPFSGHIENGFIHGRGASDMKCGLAGLVFTMGLFRRLDIPLAGKLSLLVVPDEETGGEYGVPWVLERSLIHGSAAVIAEPSHPQHPTIGQKGSCWFEVEIEGTPGHGSLSPVIGDSAILKAVKAIEVLQNIWNFEVKIPDEMKEIIEITKAYIRKREETDTSDVLDHITVNIGTIHGGTKANVIADHVVIQVDTRLPFGVQNEEMFPKVRKLLADAGIEAKVRPIGFQSTANWTPPTNEIVSSLVESIKQVSQKDAYGVLQWASSDARHFRAHNIPVLQYGPADLPTIHSYNERAPIDQVIQAAKVYALTSLKYLGVK
ncbi:ArgE/DapE family deacylase [Shimazuella alba]|uniref:Probable succinyl-diaminopimelate desuccinylase n=1 Tax=Shimazuella alba TaxID=2690964 RepID=A0A6I4VPN3_9BACL|nr:ArgE/DapE family deacylase [Shimazuella alba]